MLRSIDSHTELFLDSMNQNARRMERAQREISTSKSFSSVSDNPDQVSTLLQAQADASSNQTVSDNLGRVKAEVDGGEQALSSAVTLLEQARTLAAQGSSGMIDADAKKTIGGVVGSILEQLGGLSRTNVEGRYIFAGDSDQIAPYTVDLSQAAPISSYQGSAATRQIQHPNGTRFTVAHTAQDIFDSPQSSENVFYAVNNLRTALLANDDTGIKSALADVTTSLSYLNGQLAFYGTVQNKVAEATDTAQRRSLQLSTQIGSLQDADMTQAILAFQQGTTQQQAALQVQARIPRSTLFDYLG